MDAPTPPAASTPPAEPVTPSSPSDTLASLSDADRQTWRETGEIPTQRVEPVSLDDEGDDEPEPPAAVVAPPPALSKRQQKINEQIRVAVEAATKDTTAELARLRASAQPAPRQEPPKTAPAPALKADPTDPEPDPTDTEKYPGGEYDPKYLRAAAAWDNRQELRKRDDEAQTRDRQQHAEQDFRARAKATSDAWEARKVADPDFVKRLDPALLERLIPSSQVPDDMPAGPINLIAEEMMAHPDTAPDVTEYLSTHPEELARLTATDRQGVPLISARQLIREIGRIEGALKRGVEPPPPPNSITDAPAPPTTLGNRSTTADPTESALKRGDVAAYIAAENAKEAAAFAARK